MVRWPSSFVWLPYAHRKAARAFNTPVSQISIQHRIGENDLLVSGLSCFFQGRKSFLKVSQQISFYFSLVRTGSHGHPLSDWSLAKEDSVTFTGFCRSWCSLGAGPIFPEHLATIQIPEKDKGLWAKVRDAWLLAASHCCCGSFHVIAYVWIAYLWRSEVANSLLKCF